uniref:Uncharacterized protein n=1 Tax=Anguilla anguilla TaxID=7936 RepID=A0A0E9UI58_ANGAN
MRVGLKNNDSILTQRDCLEVSVGMVMQS